MHGWVDESILKRVVPSNFNWFLHTMLFYHIRHVLERQNQRNDNVDDDDDGGDSGDEYDSDGVN